MVKGLGGALHRRPIRPPRGSERHLPPMERLAQQVQASRHAAVSGRYGCKLRLRFMVGFKV